MNIASTNNPLMPVAAPVEPVAAREVLQDQRELIHAVRAINASGILGEQNELTFVLERGTRRAVARIVNKETREVVQQIPAEYVLRMAEEMKRG